MIDIDNELEKYKDKNIAVLLGGLSSEREISIRSGTNVFNALKKLGLNCITIDVDRNIASRLLEEKIDIAVVMLHGKYGEDGCIQGLLEVMGIPYTGPGVLCSAIGMNKRITKKILKTSGIPVPSYVDVDFSNLDKTVEEASKFGFPLIVKPNTEGSSIGVKKVSSKNELKETLENYEYKDCFIEKFIDGKEITVGSILTKYEYIELPFLGLLPQNEFYDFEAKYTKGKTIMELPARVSKKTEEKIRNYLKTAFYDLNIYGVARFDLILDNEENPFFLEVNTLPGMTETSDIPAMAKAAGMSFEELVLYILRSAEK
jgi:D-alanine-D-alanine ligase